MTRQVEQRCSDESPSDWASVTNAATSPWENLDPPAHLRWDGGEDRDCRPATVPARRPATARQLADQRVRRQSLSCGCCSRPTRPPTVVELRLLRLFTRPPTVDQRVRRQFLSCWRTHRVGVRPIQVQVGGLGRTAGASECCPPRFKPL